MPLVPTEKGIGRFSVITVLILCAAIGNTFAGWLAGDVLKTPFFIDSTFTILMGILFGWLPGVLTGLITNLLMELTFGNGLDILGIYASFAVVNMATGLCSGLMARRGERFWTIQNQVYLILLLVLVNSFLGSLVAVIQFDGLTGTAPDILVTALLLTGQRAASSAFLGRVLLNMVDKGVPVLIIFGIRRYWIARKSSADRVF